MLSTDQIIGLHMDLVNAWIIVPIALIKAVLVILWFAMLPHGMFLSFNPSTCCFSFSNCMFSPLLRPTVQTLVSLIGDSRLTVAVNEGVCFSVSAVQLPHKE